MSVMSRLRTSIYARVDRLVSQIENHDAQIEAAIREAREKVAAGKVRLARVRRDGDALAEKIASLNKAEQRWTERARAIGAGDEAKALACLRRRRACSEERESVEQAYKRHCATLEALEQSMDGAEAQLRERIQRHRLMRGRESAAEARLVTDRLNQDHLGDMEDVFDRWETRILGAEMASEDALGENIDEFERGFEQAENDESLRAELDALLQKGEG